MDKRFLGILAALIVIFAGVFVISQRSSSNNSGATPGNGQPTNHVEGLGQKGVTLIEYGDYECPVCKEYEPPLNQAQAQLNNDIYFQFRNLPLTTRHPNAFAAARAAEAAGMQNKYWQMHDALYENQNAWATASNPKPAFDTYAKNLGLDMTKFDSDYASSQANDSINADIAAFLSTSYANHNVNKEATPTFFLDGKYVSNDKFIDANGVSVSKIVSVINAEIAAKNKAQ